MADCSICVENYDDVNHRRTALNCGHILCGVCANTVDKCPHCRTRITSRTHLYDSEPVYRSGPTPQTGQENSSPLKIFDKFDVNYKVEGFVRNGNRYVRIRPECKQGRRRSKIICVLDVSGSMGSEACKIEGSSASYSRLDLLKQAMYYLISSLEEQDSLCVIKFSTRSSVILEPSLMNSSNKLIALERIKSLTDEENTYILPALKEAINRCSYEDYTSIVLLTDGDNTNTGSSPTDKIPSIISKEIANKNCTISTIGFGPNIPESFLFGIAESGFGVFAYAHDISMISTVFQYFFLNTILTVKPRASIILNDQKYTLNLRANIPAYFKVNSLNSLNISIADMTSIVTTISVDQDMIDIIDYMEFIDFCMKDSSNALRNLQTLYSKIKNTSILDDLSHKDTNKGQIEKSLKNIYTWGQKHLTSTISQLKSQTASNFKDKVPNAFFVNEDFDKMVEFLCEKSKDIEIVKPSLSQSQENSYSMNTGSNYNPPPPTSQLLKQQISVMNNPDGSCFDGNTLVILQNGSLNHLKELKAGDMLFGNKKVLCLTRSVGSYQLYDCSGIHLTAWHPYKLYNTWVFPHLHNSSFEVTEVYNIVLENGSFITCFHENSYVDVATLGHGLKDNDVIKHEYLGTFKCVEDLKKLKGWNEGFIDNLVCIRDQQTGLICGFSN